MFRCFRPLLAVILPVFIGLSAHAQDVERLPFSGQPPGGGEDIGEARLIRSGALLIASFDANHDFLVTDAEITAGARSSFAFADADESGFVSPIEQRAWASQITSESDVLGNPTMFAGAIPGQVNEDEFVAGILIFADRFRNEEGVVPFSELTFAPRPRRPNRGRDNRPDPPERLPQR